MVVHTDPLKFTPRVRSCAASKLFREESRMFGYQMARLSMARRPLLALEIGATWHKSVSGDLRWVRVVHALVHSDK